MKKVVVAPLDWGLGHATRCIPIIHELIRLKCNVILAGSGASLKLLQFEFPNLKSFELPAYEPKYQGRDGSMVTIMALQLSKFIRTIRAENAALSKIVAEAKIDYVISDNRYGCYSTTVPCAFITHQSNIMMPKRFGWLQGLVRKANIAMMQEFTEVWIPDAPGDASLAGNLASIPSIMKARCRYIGFLSRFKKIPEPHKIYDVVAVFSGPEPQRTLLEEKVLPQLKTSGLRYFVVRGKIENERPQEEGIADFLTTPELQKLFASTDLVIARSGYSTIMDLASLSKKAILIPTPQQTEQQYLADLLSKKGIAHCVQQEDFDLSKDYKKALGVSGSYGISMEMNFLTFAVKSFVNL